MNGTGDGFEPIGQDTRVERLDARLEQVEAREAERLGIGKPVEADEGYKTGNVVLSLLLGGLIAGAGLGWLADRVFGSSPWGLLIGLALGIGGAFWRIVQISMAKTDG